MSIRPRQCSKNLLVFPGLLFAKWLSDSPSVIAAIGVFTIFRSLSAVVYLINEVADRKSDRRHPVLAYSVISWVLTVVLIVYVPS